ncbi:merozoite capping protein-1 [Sclerotinia borealis F-4128]|uniref:thioredoxin-dependent peroxiredoxin n=1 Tax=Sclerotinia borealis (strain F-4128) TaxID=1432307 RepID=W9CSF6_SCLBF|nr:merozoite capping protein-1 [Sclerotinia borealis F-4128]
MPVTLRKRPAPAEPPASAPPAKKKSGVVKTVAKVKETIKKAVEPKATKTSKTDEPVAAALKTNGSKAVAAAPAPAPVPVPSKIATKVVVGETIDLEGFGGEIETNDGEKTTLKKLVDESKSGVVLFTYPKASTPGCTTQVCAFRDSHTSLSDTGYSIYGLSKDSPKANTTFKTKQKLPYTLLCDTKASLISAIGLKKGNSTTRGVFIIDKSGKVLAAQPGSPKGTLEVVEQLIGPAEEESEVEATPEPIEPETEIVTEGAEAKAEAAPEEEEKEEEKTEKNTVSEERATNGTNGDSASKEDAAKADVAADVADTAEKLDSKDSEIKAAEDST